MGVHGVQVVMQVFYSRIVALERWSVPARLAHTTQQWLGAKMHCIQPRV